MLTGECRILCKRLDCSAGHFAVDVLSVLPLIRSWNRTGLGKWPKGSLWRLIGVELRQHVLTRGHLAQRDLTSNENVLMSNPQLPPCDSVCVCCECVTRTIYSGQYC